MRKLAAVILAAGVGVRMKSPLAKVLHLVCGVPMVRHVASAVKELSASPVVVVVPPANGETIQKHVGGLADSYVIQEKPLGTGDALLRAVDLLRGFDGHLLVTCGDTPLLSSRVLEELLAFHLERKSKATILSTFLENPCGYGRIVRKGRRVVAIVEERDATPSQRKINEINAGTYVFSSREIFKVLPRISNRNAQKEFYLTDVIRLLTRKNLPVYAFPSSNPENVLGVNTRRELLQVNEIMQRRILDHHLNSGVSIIHPSTTLIAADVTIGEGTTIYPFTILEGGTTIGEHCAIGPGARIVRSHVASGTTVQYSILVEAEVGEGCQIGPFAYLRPESKLKKKVRVGNFVEIKKSTIGNSSKVPHLSYIGDATIGDAVNIGAGVITCNYDGKGKFPTFIEDEAFIGSNTNLRAPLRIGKGAVTGAGSVVTRDVEPYTLVVGVPARVVKKIEGH